MIQRMGKLASWQVGKSGCRDLDLDFGKWVRYIPYSPMVINRAAPTTTPNETSSKSEYQIIRPSENRSRFLITEVSSRTVAGPE